MSKITYDSSGLNHILKNIKKNKDDALAQVGERTVKRAKELAAVDTGEMRDKINYEIDRGVLYVKADADHSSFVEYGTVKMAAQPFMTPAIREVRQELPRMFPQIVTGGRAGQLLSNITRSVKTWLFG